MGVDVWVFFLGGGGGGGEVFIPHFFCTIHIQEDIPYFGDFLKNKTSILACAGAQLNRFLSNLA